MKTIEQIKNQVAKRHGYAGWIDALCELMHYRYRPNEFEAMENIAIIEWGNQCKEAQRESDAKAVDKDVPHGAILNNPLVIDKID